MRCFLGCQTFICKCNAKWQPSVTFFRVANGSFIKSNAKMSTLRIDFLSCFLRWTGPILQCAYCHSCNFKLIWDSNFYFSKRIFLLKDGIFGVTRFVSRHLWCKIHLYLQNKKVYMIKVITHNQTSVVLKNHSGRKKKE